MKKNILKKGCAISCMLLFLFSCVSCNFDDDTPSPSEKKSDSGNELSGDNKEKETGSSTIPSGGIVAAPYFWGTWVRMDNGKEYQFSERYITFNSRYYENTSGTESDLTVKELGTFKKQSDAVLLLDSVPLFRKGGANLEYTLKLVGFSDVSSSSRAALSADGVAGLTVTGRSENYPSHQSEAVSDSEGKVHLKAPVAGDKETIVVSSGNTTYLTTGLQVNNNGSNMGTIPIVGENDCSLKVTGRIPESVIKGGYLYANKTYDKMEITIENIGDVDCTSAHVFVTAANPDVMSLSGDTDFNVTTLNPGRNKKQYVTLEIGSFSESYIDTGINVTIELSDADKRNWEDFIPLRIFRGQMPVTIAAQSTENNQNAQLNGFLIYPDGNNKFFSISHNGEGTLYVPTFKSNESFMLVFSGATTSGELAKSTEMFYTVAVDQTKAKPIITTGSDVRGYMTFGEESGGNESENTAYEIDSANTSFEAYLKDSDRDFYRISIESSSSTYYGAESFYSLKVDSYTHNEAVLSWNLTSGVVERDIHLYKNGVLEATNVTSPYTVKKLNGNTKYTFGLKSPENDEISGSTTIRTKESPALNLSYAGVTDTSVTLQIVNNNASDATVYIFMDNEFYAEQAISNDTEAYSVTVTGLKKDTYYTFVLKDVNSVYGNNLSGSITVKTSSLPPVVGKPVITVNHAYARTFNYTGAIIWDSTEFSWTPCTSGAAKYNVYAWSEDDYATMSVEKMMHSSLNYFKNQNPMSKTSAKHNDISLYAYYYLYYIVVPVDYEGNEWVENASDPVWVQITDYDAYSGTTWYKWGTQN